VRGALVPPIPGSALTGPGVVGLDLSLDSGHNYG